MRKTVATIAITTLLSIGFPVVSHANEAWPVQPPAEWSVPYHAKFMKYKGKDCWKYWRVTKCLP